MPMTETVRDDGVHMVTASRAAAELELRRGEFALAVHLGIIRMESQESGGRARVRQEEIARLTSQDGFPETLRERVRTMGTAEGAGLLGVSPVRFARLARAGCVTPVAFYLNRYRVVVWLYLAHELGQLASRSPELLVGNAPPWLRSRLDAGMDCRARNWRSRRTELLLALAEDPWARAAVVAEALDPVQLAEVVDDPYERAYFARVRPAPVFGRGGSPAGREATAKLMLADEPDEILWRRITLGMELDSARELRPAPRPGEGRWPASADDPAISVEPDRPLELGEGATERSDPGLRGGHAPSARERDAPDAQQDGAPGSGGQARVDGGGSGVSGLLTRLRLRRSRGSRRPRRAVGGGKGKPLATDTRTRHSLHHVDQGSHR
ncbi:DUF6397 family protein [Streptomyces sp. NPDC005786]|uniref:DUF6397 family protein n=1 Tax=Streptomyces sp. NPDC005786 TaxID=3154891 RepID=UPI0033D0EC5F